MLWVRVRLFLSTRPQENYEEADRAELDVSCFDKVEYSHELIGRHQGCCSHDRVSYRVKAIVKSLGVTFLFLAPSLGFEPSNSRHLEESFIIYGYFRLS